MKLRLVDTLRLPKESFGVYQDIIQYVKDHSEDIGIFEDNSASLFSRDINLINHCIEKAGEGEEVIKKYCVTSRFNFEVMKKRDFKGYDHITQVSVNNSTGEYVSISITADVQSDLMAYDRRTETCPVVNFVKVVVELYYTKDNSFIKEQLFPILSLLGIEPENMTIRGIGGIPTAYIRSDDECIHEALELATHWCD